MSKAKNGDVVRVHYTGTLKDGTVFDSSEPQEESSCGSCCSSGGCGPANEPLEFTLGEGQVIPGFEKAVLGLAVGESIDVEIPCDQAYGPRHDQMVAVVERTELSGEVEPIEGQHLDVVLQDGNTMPVLISAVTETHVTLDANHPLAGKDLNFNIRLVEIV